MWQNRVNVYVTGKFKDWADFEPGSAETWLSAKNGFDAFVGIYATEPGVAIDPQLSLLEYVRIYPNPAQEQCLFPMEKPAFDQSQNKSVGFAGAFFDQS